MRLVQGILDGMNEWSFRLQNYRLIVCDPENTEGASNMHRSSEFWKFAKK